MSREQAIYRGKLTGELNANSHKITGLASPTADTDAATKQYCDDHGGGTRDYAELNNKPQIASVTLSGNKTLAELGAAAASDLTALTTRVSTAENTIDSHASTIATHSSAIANKQDKLNNLNGILKSNGSSGNVSVATADTDYAKAKLFSTTTSGSATTIKELTVEGVKTTKTESEWSPSETLYREYTYIGWKYDSIRWDATNTKWICRAWDYIDLQFEYDVDMGGTQKNNASATELEWPTTPFEPESSSTTRTYSTETATLATTAALAEKQDKLTAGNSISISANYKWTSDHYTDGEIWTTSVPTVGNKVTAYSNAACTTTRTDFNEIKCTAANTYVPWKGEEAAQGSITLVGNNVISTTHDLSTLSSSMNTLSATVAGHTTQLGKALLKVDDFFYPGFNVHYNGIISIGADCYLTAHYILIEGGAYLGQDDLGNGDNILSLNYSGTGHDPLIKRNDSSGEYSGKIIDWLAGKLSDSTADFSTSSTYAVGAFVKYGGALYVCHTAVATAGAWTGATNWTAMANLSSLFGSSNTSLRADNIRMTAADSTTIKSYIDTAVGNIETLLAAI